MRNGAYGVLLIPGIFLGLAIGIYVGQPMAGVVIGTGVAIAVATLAALR